MNNDFVTPQKARKMLGVTTQTLHRWDKTGKIRSVRVPSGVRRYYHEDIQNILSSANVVNQKKKVAYCRVSSKHQNDDLERQINYFKTEYPDYEVVADIGSGINWKRKAFRAILEGAMRGDISEVMVAHRDRLCRFGFELVEWLLQQYKVKITVLHSQKDESSNSDLAADLLSIIHIYSCREMGRRRYSKSKKDASISNVESKENIETVDRDIKICL